MTSRRSTVSGISRVRVTARRSLYRVARRVLWTRVRERAPGLRSALRRRLAEFLRGRDRGFLLRLLRESAFAAAVAASLLGAGTAHAIELADVAEGRGGFVIHGENGYDRSGWSVSTAGDVNGDGISDAVIGAPGYRLPGINDNDGAGATYVVFGAASREPVELADVAASWGGFVVRGENENDGSGFSVSGAGDVNGDGLADIVIGAPGADPRGRLEAGATYVVFGKADGGPVELADVAAGTGGFVIRGTGVGEFGEYSGSSVSGAGDVNGDGLADVVIGAPGYFGSNAESYVVFGKADTEAVELSDVARGPGGFLVRGPRGAFNGHGASVSGAGDVNGDGLADVVVGSYYDTFVVFGKADGDTVDLPDVATAATGFAIRSVVATTWGQVSGVGDLNGDGLADVVVGAPIAEGLAGESYVVFGKADPDPVTLEDVGAGRGGFVIRGQNGGDWSGRSVSGGGDLNGDRIPDLLIGAPSAQTSASYVVSGKADGEPVELSDVSSGVGGFVIRGSGSAGWSVSGAGDLNGDGFSDILIGDPQADPEQAGATYVVFGGPEVGVPRFRRGEVNDDGHLNITDGVRLLGHLFRGASEPPCLDAADVDDDGRLELTDAVFSFRYLFARGPLPPEPGPSTCGPDPTDDDLGCARPTAGCG